MTDVTKESVGLQWEEPESNGGNEIQNYIVEKRDVTKTNWLPVTTVTGDNLSCTATKLFEGTQYLFRVSAENKVGTGPATELSEPVTASLPYGKDFNFCSIFSLCSLFSV